MNPSNSDWTSKLQRFVDGIASSVAVVELGEADQLMLTACNASFFEMVGGKRSVIREFPFPLDSVVPSYTRRELTSAIRKCFDSGEPHEMEQAYDLKDRTYWWRRTLKPFKSDLNDEQIRGVLLTGLDISAKTQLQHELEISTSRFRSVVDAAYDAIVTIDQRQNITLFNRAAENLFGYEQSEVLNRPLENLIPMEFRTHHPEHIHRFAMSPVKSRQMDERNRVYGLHRDGSRIPVEIAISKINVGGLVEFTAIIRDITDRVHLMDLLQKQAATDPLTGLPNRREFTSAATHLMQSHSDFSVLMLDVDFFKRVNDTKGHDAGDEVPRALAKVGTSTVRHRDIFARLGGEEFAVAMPGTNADQAMLLGERLRAIFDTRDFDFDWKHEPIPFTVSIGVASLRAPREELAELLKRADEALYRAKANGRNRVEV